MGKIYCLIGRSAVGKSTIEKMLLKQGSFLPIVSYTTRPKRESEVDGIDYHFITDEQFQEMLANGEFAETSEYRGWHYGATKASIQLDKGNYIFVVETEGFKQVLSAYGKENVVGIYLYLNDYWELLLRSVNRQPHATAEQCKEMCRRFISDFDTFNEIEKYCVLKINNLNANDTVDIILRNIKNGI